MKKVISVLLSVLMLFSLVTVSSYAADNTLKIIVASDLHYSLAGVSSASGKYTDKDYSHITETGALRIESGAIIDAFLKSASESDCSTVLLAGDLADRGLIDEHTAVAEKLAAFEAETGKQIYVIPGNHDHLNTTNEEFKALYAQFGYDEAITHDELSASYVADLNDEYRLIAIDSGDYKGHDCSITPERVQWIKMQAELAKSEGKNAIAIMHHNLVNHLAISDIFYKGSYADPELGLAEIFAENNVKYTFSGHSHAQDIKAYTGENGTVIYDVLTSSLNIYPCLYREITFGKNVSFEAKKITAIDASCLEGVVTESCYKLAESDFSEYAEACLNYGHGIIAYTYLNAGRIKSILGLDKETDAEICTLIDKLAPEIRELFFMPIYKADEIEKGKSLEAMSKKFNIALPKTDISTLAELFITIYQGYTFGDESFGILSDEYRLLIASVTVLLNELLSDVSSDEYALLLSFICNRLGADKMPEFFLKYTADGISRAKGIDIFVSTVINTAALSFITDESPSDNFATLAGYDQTVTDKENLSFFDKLVNFFISIFDFILRFFGAGK